MMDNVPLFATVVCTDDTPVCVADPVEEFDAADVTDALCPKPPRPPFFAPLPPARFVVGRGISTSCRNIMKSLDARYSTLHILPHINQPKIQKNVCKNHKLQRKLVLQYSVGIYVDILLS